MGLIDRLLGRTPPPPTAPLYDAVVARGRAAHWYVDGAVPDTIDGRFDMIAAVLCLVLLRLEALDERRLSVALTERFIDDMDAQLRQSGVGDVGIGKHVGQMMAMLGGRLGAYRDGLATGDLVTPLARNLYRGAAPGPQAMEHVEAGLRAFNQALSVKSAEALAAGLLA